MLWKKVASALERLRKVAALQLTLRLQAISPEMLRSKTNQQNSQDSVQVWIVTLSFLKLLSTVLPETGIV